MNTDPKSRDWKQLIWPVAGILTAIGLAAALNPAKAQHITFADGIAIWFAAMMLALILPAHPVGARIGAFVVGLFMAVPCFVYEPPLARGLLMCLMSMPFLIAAAFVVIPPINGLRARLEYLSTHCKSWQIDHHARRFDAASLIQLVIATVILAVASIVVIKMPAHGLWLPMRWLIGGIAILAFGEMATAALPLVSNALGVTVPALMQSPYRSASISEFWNERWNSGASCLLRNVCYKPLARSGVALAMFTTFFVSGIVHTLLFYMASGNWEISLFCGAFFLVQPLLIIAERRMNIRQWHPAAQHAWTLTALAITSPLIVEPTFQIIEESWNPSQNVLPPTIAVLGFVIIFSGVVALAAAASKPATAAEG